MKRLYIRIKSGFEKDVFKFKESEYDFLRFHLGTNSISLSLVLLFCLVVSFNADVLNWNYLKGISNDLSFFIGAFSILLGMICYKFWKLDEKSVFTIHFAKTKFVPKGVNTLFIYNDFTFAISRKIKTDTVEYPTIIRQLICVGIFFNLALITLDNGEFDKLKRFPSEILQTKTEFCPDKEEALEDAPAKEGCELIIRAYKLGYAKDLGICEPKKIDPEKMKICQKRRADEPYIHYMSRLMIDSVEDKVEYFDNDKIKKIKDKFDLQLEKLEILKDFKSYAMSAAPRASHHIWTNLPYPENIFVQRYREVFKPSYCIEQFQNQTNTVNLEQDDARKDSKLLEHVYGQLLFNPKSDITVGFCKEYKIHWDSKPDTCERLAENPKAVLQEEKVLAEVELVLKRHDIANEILALDEKIHEVEKNEEPSLTGETKDIKPSGTNKQKYGKKPTGKIIKSKIAKAKQQLRKKNELVSFQCFMQEKESLNKNITNNLKLNSTDFLVRTRFFPMFESKGESQISMYKEFSRVLENRFHYSQLTSRSDIKIDIGEKPSDERLLEEPTYLFSRLEMLKNVDIFLGNSWVLERDDLLGVYPYHVHLQNYVNSFREEYQESRGRL